MDVFILTYKSPFSSVPEFIENELPFWPKDYKIKVISLAGKYKQDMYGVYNLSNIDAHSISPINLWGILRISLHIINLDFLKELYICVFKFPLFGILNRVYQLVRYEFSKFRYYFGLEEIFLKVQPLNNDVLIYSYWLGAGTSAAMKFKKVHSEKSRIRIISRTHGSDLYPFALKTKYLPYHKDNLKKLDLIVPISFHGYCFLKELNISKKIELFKLGIPDFNTQNSLPSRTDIFNIVSCSYLTSIKQVHLIVEALSLIEDVTIYWRHIGGGPQFKSIEQLCNELLCDKKNISYNILGNLTNHEVISFYQKENINLFINTSKSEGIPVTFMEANCFGIPIVAPDIGGITEILKHNENGILMNKNFTVGELKDSILSMISLDEEKYYNLCLNSRRLFLLNYEETKNYGDFVEFLIKNFNQ